ncbi:hypothetical protein PVK06_017518 [Gossypium arboreum]|uniref:Uncharacterized protein n=1 Tax=Gossypium arboreum TaxID=29729 RepID=A0ABR0Q2V7_GOSAR|nr:hypothetical protein PVK06_017518 [Gossypium arboreum]
MPLQVAMGPFDLHHMNFKRSWPLIKTILGFDVLNPTRAIWRKFQKKWKEFGELFYDHDSNTSDLDSSSGIASEDETYDDPPPL